MLLQKLRGSRADALVAQAGKAHTLTRLHARKLSPRKSVNESAIRMSPSLLGPHS